MIKAQQRARIEVLAAAAVLAAGVAACGSGSSSSTSRSSSTGSATGGATSRTSSGTGSAAPASGGAAPTGPKFHAVLTGQDHAPIATKTWNYTVRATTASGKPLAGTVDTEFAFGGQVVGRETPPTHRLKNGVLKDTIQFPKQAVGQPIELQVVVHTSAGSQTLDWAVDVKP